MTVNKLVSVDSFYFINKKSELKSFPREITWSGHTVTFANGLRYLVGQGVQIFDMADQWGRQTYRLRRDGNNWTLLTVKGGC